jgi:retinol dehydrogenase 12
MGDLDGRTFLVTGANTGIGLATATALAVRGGRVHVACRSEQKGQAAQAAIAAAAGPDHVSFLKLDLADLASVRASARQFLALGEPLHVLVNNAGIGGQKGLTKDGFELMFGVNHLGHFALTIALLDRLTSSQARIVNVASDAHYAAKGIDFDQLRHPARGITGMAGYSVSKLCNVLFTQELARRLAGTGVTSYALHLGHLAPGAVADPPADHPPHADRRAGCPDVPVLRDRARARRGQRPLLRQLRRARTEPSRHSRSCRPALAA